MSLLKQNPSKNGGNGVIPGAASSKHDGRMMEIRRLMKIQSSFNKNQVDYYSMLQQIFGDDLASQFIHGPKLIKKCTRAWHNYVPNVILTTYFTSRHDPQTHEPVNGDDIKYIYPWYASMRISGEHGIIFHDNLSQKFIKRYETDLIKFVRCRLTNRSLNDQRFMIYLQFLLSNPYSKIFMTDVADVIVNRSPFPLVNEPYSNSLFVGRDRYNLNGHSSYMAGLVKDYQYLTGNSIDNYFANCPMYNAGIIGGSYLTVLFLVFKICKELLTLRNVRDHNMNMLVLNYVIHNYFYDTPSVRLFESPFKNFEISEEILTNLPHNNHPINLSPGVAPGHDSHCNSDYVRSGFPLCSPFFAFDFHSKACFIHK
jgi:hypothetical protein